MTDQENIKAIQTHIASFGQGDIDAVCLQCTEDVVWTPPISDGRIPYNKPWSGRDGVREYCTLLMGNLEWQSFEVPVIVADQNDHVVILGREVFTIRKTGKTVDNTFLTLFTMRDGLIAGFTLCENTELVAAAFAGS
ncbi:hypothetical protein F1188_17515 [Roseospira marina]|uniref:SnoaL-like domain-containing protein n=1 Tax=Roseospira marina TaxID=140057 RepID=A0A5M6I8L1_9PROT|nr:nuclear transport factor 2 family protein [Roseospira marina]KAA5604089.1 hypothetical protein F1188_17515 [Roseospira marina]MBB4315812.1 ketosteroid isomerase-like protein [Roseospira marina]MBB5088949.1 ketosteroid isomerase-like protein [Roseospira marina]